MQSDLSAQAFLSSGVQQASRLRSALHCRVCEGLCGLTKQPCDTNAVAQAKLRREMLSEMYVLRWA